MKLWNHPGWRQENEIPIWYKEHSWLLGQNMFHGIEIVNEKSYYPLAHQWAIDSNLTMLGNSDIHDPIDLFFDKCEGEHRPITLVFSKEKSEEGIKDALFENRTAVLHAGSLFGPEDLLLKLFVESMETIIDTLPGFEEKASAYVRSNSSIPYVLMWMDEEGNELDQMTFTAGVITEIDETGETGKGKCLVKNLYVAPGQCLELSIFDFCCHK